MPDASTDTVFPPSPMTPSQADFDDACKPEMGVVGHVDIKAARDVSTPAVTGSVAPSSPPEEVSLPEKKRPPHVSMYQSIGIQTWPLATGRDFAELYGREPTRWELEHKLGVAGLGRLGPTGTNVHDYLRSEETPIPDKLPGSEQVSTGFQTLGFQVCNANIIKAKAKASLRAAKYSKAAAAEGFKIWGEVKEEKVVHSEQFTFSVELDSLGNAKNDKDIAGLFLPNLYRDDLIDQSGPRTAARRTSKPLKTTCAVSPQKVTPAQSPPALCELLYGPFQPIPSLEPADREDPEEPEASEETSEEEYCNGWPEWYGNFVPDLLSAYAPEDDDDSFVVFDPAKVPVPIPSGPRLQKRKAREETVEKDQGHRSKRVRSLSPKRRASKTKDRPTQEDDRRERQRSPSRGRGRAASRTDTRSLSPVPRPRRRPSITRVETSHRADGRRDNRHISLRSRSPDGKRRNSKEVYRVRDTSRRRSRDRDNDTRFSSRKDDKHESHRHRGRDRAHTPQDAPSTKTVRDNTKIAAAPTPTPPPAKAVGDTKDPSKSRPRPSKLPQPTTPRPDATAQTGNPARVKDVKQLVAKVQAKTKERPADAVQARIDDITSAREVENRRREAHNAIKQENSAPRQPQKDRDAAPRQVQEHDTGAVKSRLPQKLSELPKKIAKSIDPPKSIVKAIVPPKNIAKEVEPPRNNAKKVEPPKNIAKAAEPLKKTAKEIEPAKKIAKKFEPSNNIVKAVAPPERVVKQGERPKHVVQEIKQPKSIVKQVEPPSKVQKAVPTTEKISKKGLPATKVTDKKALPKIGQHTVTVKKVVSAPERVLKKVEPTTKFMDKKDVPKKEQHIVPARKVEIRETPKPEMDEREHDKLQLHPPQRGRKRSSGTLGPTAGEDMTPQKKAKKDSEQAQDKAIPNSAVANSSTDKREQKKSEAASKKAVPRPKRPEMQRFVPRAQRDAQANGGPAKNDNSGAVGPSASGKGKEKANEAEDASSQITDFTQADIDAATLDDVK
ncbi:hypothetical protein CC86DRAFT_467771 [Ophiobolus disseminans]|uniref:Uncharacterized protein n=1 Tax=Ophiobolus disseminans TaxID=1469910 RepID=A0A6A6ZW43_9PLEO|nr:hypothetical protein CC86DRAFT_467771 [Ophiobolus disseminans]